MQRGWKTAALALIAAVTVTSTAFAQRQGRGGAFGGGGAQLLQIPEVQGELKLTDEQKTKVATMLEQLRSERQGQPRQQGLSPEERQKVQAERTAKEDTLVGAILDGDQVKRYHQLVLQRSGPQAFTQKTVADKLGLNADQQEKIQGFIRDSRQGLRDAFQPGGDPQALQAKMAAMNKDTMDKIQGVLTDSQKSQWKEMLGAPFAFPANAQGFGFGRRRNNNNNN